MSALLDRLQGVRETGPRRFLARCPAHDDHDPSLSVRELEDRTLLHCFAGCAPTDVLAAVGLDLRDLFPDRPGEHRRSPSHSRIPAADTLAAIDHEVHVVAIIAADMLSHREIDPPTWDRLALAVERIGEARAVVTPARHKVAA
jgi:hypothetical protein